MRAGLLFSDRENRKNQPPTSSVQEKKPSHASCFGQESRAGKSDLGCNRDAERHSARGNRRAAESSLAKSWLEVPALSLARTSQESARGIEERIVLSPTHWCWVASGRPRDESCEDVPSVCWVCGGSADRSILVTEWSGAEYASQHRVKAWDSDRVCEPCIVIHSRISPVPGRPPLEGKKYGGNWRTYSVLIEVVGGSPILETATKAEKDAIRKWLRKEKRGEWFAAIADSGKKHVIPLAQMNAPGVIGVVQFEEAAVKLPDSWDLVSDAEEALSVGLSKRGLLAGNYTVEQWTLYEGVIEQFEARWAQERGGAWFELALFLAQKRESDESGTEETGDRTDDRAPAASQEGVSRARRKLALALGADANSARNRKPDSSDDRSVVLDPSKGPASGGSQLTLL